MASCLQVRRLPARRSRCDVGDAIGRRAAFLVHRSTVARKGGVILSHIVQLDTEVRDADATGSGRLVEWHVVLCKSF